MNTANSSYKITLVVEDSDGEKTTLEGFFHEVDHTMPEEEEKEIN